MAIAQEIVRRALRLCGIVASGETPDPAAVQDAVSVLNGMLSEMHSAQIGLPQYSVTNELTTVQTDAGDNEALAYMLAMRIMPEYGMVPDPVFAAAADQSMSRLRLKYFQPGVVNLDELPARSHWAFDIQTGV